MTRPIASLSMDLDNQWAYLRAAGREDWAQRPGYLPQVIDRIVDVLGDSQLPLTVFVVGRDLSDDDVGRSNIDAIESFDRLADWEAANHSLNHLPWMHTMDQEQIVSEIETTHQRIAQSLGRRPLGFRGPGFSCPDSVLRVLSELDYAYDASIFPTSIAPIARMAFLIKSDLKGEQRERAKKLYGGFSSLRQPNRPFLRTIDDSQLWEMPVTVMPWTRTPIHFSYFTYLASFSTLAAKTYFRTAIRLCRMTGTPPSLLLHPPDFLGSEDDHDMSYFPAMNMAVKDKLAIVRWALELYAETFDVRTMIGQLRDSVAGVDERIGGPNRDADHPSLPSHAGHRATADSSGFVATDHD
ncbi:Polysaccharide deacetylase [Rubripirellula lacrimiformis]|uniref:Polysaccharide deacetylase n=1 Tax=Rubripirellula lacrimiformis TaxID=1930273 RepID=A0A517N6X9_9BACT|nr:polysaccharide deacetylase family protein [Rubripirellula lacrimiformis]QDT02870.1 Polysaccharide deacetylase [Rubripirellula lacrimiformis]